MARGRPGYRAIWFGDIRARGKRRGIKRRAPRPTIGTWPQTNSPMIPRARAGAWGQGVRAAVGAENVLLILSLTETQVVFSLPIPIAGGLVGALERVLSLMQTGPRA
jgi:hypothetical protein